jgi:DNA polymerase III subunit epsilon
MREIVLDTETTGFEPSDGHRMVEIGCVELIDRQPTGKTFHSYFNPERDMPEDALKVHGITSQFLADKPRFGNCVDELLTFLGDAPLVAHNAAFDVAFLNAELRRISYPFAIEPHRVVDTLVLARRAHPGVGHSLDELCKLYHIDNSEREKHGALLDAELLAKVYIELVVARQGSFDLTAARTITAHGVLIRPRHLELRLTDADVAAHRAFILAAAIKEPIWMDYWPNEQKQEAA